MTSDVTDPLHEPTSLWPAGQLDLQSAQTLTSDTVLPLHDVFRYCPASHDLQLLQEISIVSAPVEHEPSRKKPASHLVLHILHFVSRLELGLHEVYVKLPGSQEVQGTHETGVEAPGGSQNLSKRWPAAQAGEPP